jgi:very-short-patch-repair endonuclease
VHSEGVEGAVFPGDPAGLIAGRQHGVVTRPQLRAAGLGDGAIDHRIATGRLHPVHRGVYLVGHPVFPRFAREAAALLACGEGAVLSHRTAAWFWRIIEEPPRPVDVTIPGKARAQRRGLRIHRTGDLGRRELRIREGLLVTAPARTLLDLAGDVGARELRWAFNETQVRRLVRDAELLALLDRFPRRGTRALRALIDADREPALTDSEAERRMLELIDKAGLPRPKANAHVAGHRVDLYWPEQRLVVEVDGYAFHSRRADFEHDRRREQDLAAAGIRTSRVTWRQIVDEPEAVVARLAAALAAHGSSRLM